MKPASGVANAFCQIRPPGHHAERDRAMGFCLFSTVAIAGLYARARHGTQRVAVIDFDVHHGNGTQDIFWADAGLFYGSTHQMPLFPGTGAISEHGVGNIWNAPLRAGDDGAAFRAALEATETVAARPHRRRGRQPRRPAGRAWPGYRISRSSPQYRRTGNDCVQETRQAYVGAEAVLARADATAV